MLFGRWQVATQPVGMSPHGSSQVMVMDPYVKSDKVRNCECCQCWEKHLLYWASWARMGHGKYGGPVGARVMVIDAEQYEIDDNTSVQTNHKN